MSKIEQDYINYLSYEFLSEMSVGYPEQVLLDIFKTMGYTPEDDVINHLKQMTEDLREFYKDGFIPQKEKSLIDIWAEYGITIDMEEVLKEDEEDD